MKRLTTLNSLLNNRLTSISLRQGVRAWAYLMVPLFFVVGVASWFFQTTNNEKDQIQLESLLAQNLERDARFGDLVNAKENILNKGKAFGLKAIHVCTESGREILPELNQFSCKHSGRFYKLIFNAESANIYFVWENIKPISFLFATIVFLLFSIIFFGLLILNSIGISVSISKELNSYTKFILKTDLVSDEISHKSEFIPELTDLTTSLKTKEIQNQEFQNRLNLQEKNKVIIEIARKLAHDIRSPLTAINLISKKLQTSSPIESNLLTSASKQLLGIAEDILTSSRPDSANTESRPDFPASHEFSTELNIRSGTYTVSTTATVPAIHEIVAQKSISLSEQIKLIFYNDLSDDFYHFGDILNIQRIVSNLISNSIESLPNGKGFVSVSLSDLKNNEGNQNLIIEIRDSGTGIPEDILTKLGNEQITSGKSNGNGIGVFSAMQLVRSWGGKMKIHSKTGIGTQIQITL